VVREPEGVETVPQAYLLARKAVRADGQGKTATMWQRDEGGGNR
jgi:hypothetical protein